MIGRKKEIPILCPKCRRVVGSFKDHTWSDSTFSCSKCKIYLVYCRDDDTIQIKRDEKDKRVASSGRRFL